MRDGFAAPRIAIFVVGCRGSSMSVITFRFFDSSAAYADFYFQTGTMTTRL